MTALRQTLRRLRAALTIRRRPAPVPPAFRRTTTSITRPHPQAGAGLRRPHTAPPATPVAVHLPRAAARPHVLIETGSPVRPYVLCEGAAR
ncbi:hypothetical protein ACF053_15490 [Streptomyces kanasensis]|uniref:hypothetical protein n=1 Tax=Streptomyces kanasensis TaxID=936756 RepID=UPI0036F58B40